MASPKIDAFNTYRAKMDKNMLDDNYKNIKHIFNLNANTYMEGTLLKKIKELLWLVNSLVLRYNCRRHGHFSTN